MQLCSNGKTENIRGGIFFICQSGVRIGSGCPFVRWCSKRQIHLMLDKIQCESYK